MADEPAILPLENVLAPNHVDINLAVDGFYRHLSSHIWEDMAILENNEDKYHSFLVHHERARINAHNIAHDGNPGLQEDADEEEDIAFAPDEIARLASFVLFARQFNTIADATVALRLHFDNLLALHQQAENQVHHEGIAIVANLSPPPSPRLR